MSPFKGKQNGSANGEVSPEAINAAAANGEQIVAESPSGQKNFMKKGFGHVTKAGGGAINLAGKTAGGGVNMVGKAGGGAINVVGKTAGGGLDLVGGVADVC